MKTRSPDDVAQALLPAAPRLVSALVGRHSVQCREGFSRLPRPEESGRGRHECPRHITHAAGRSARATLLLLLSPLFLHSGSPAVSHTDGLTTVTGAVEITNSHEAAVRRLKDYSGVVIWLEKADHGSSPVLVPKHVQMLQKDQHFKPHVLAIPVGSTVDFPNLDPIYHNAFSLFSGQPFDTGLYKPGTSHREVFKSPGIVRVFCNIHPTMSAIIAVVPTPWYVLTGPSGKFTIADVPPGEYQLKIFYERSLPEVLKFLEHRVTVTEEGLALPLISISETGWIQSPHLNKFGQPYPPVPNNGTYPGAPK